MRSKLSFLVVSLIFVIGLILTDAGREINSLDTEVSAQSANEPLFRLVSGSFSGDYASYSLQTPPEEKIFADDCIGCELEVGNAVIFGEFGCLNKSNYLFESNSSNGFLEKGAILDGKGNVIGESRISVFKDKSGNIISARMFWVEGNDFWSVQAPTVALTKALYKSPQYTKVREIVADELRNYVPIQNANTIGKDKCAEFMQRRISH